LTAQSCRGGIGWGKQRKSGPECERAKTARGLQPKSKKKGPGGNRTVSIVAQNASPCERKVTGEVVSTEKRAGEIGGEVTKGRGVPGKSSKPSKRSGVAEKEDVT